MAAPNSSRIDELIRQSQLMSALQRQVLDDQIQQAQIRAAAPKPTGFIDDVIRSAQSVYDPKAAPAGGVAGFLGQTGGVAAPALAGGAVGSLLGPLGTLAGLGLGGAYGTISQGRNEDTRQGRETSLAQDLIRGGVGATAALPILKGATLGSTALKNAAFGFGVGTGGSMLEQAATNGNVDVGQALQSGALSAGLGAATAPFAVRTRTPLDDVAVDAARPAAPAALPGREYPALPAPGATDRGMTGTPASPPLLPGQPKLLPGSVEQARRLTGGQTPLLPGGRTVTTADGMSTFTLEPSRPGTRLADDGGVMLGGRTEPIDAEFRPLTPEATKPVGKADIKQGQIVDGVVTEGPAQGLKVNPDGFIDRASIVPATENVFKNRSSAIRGAKNLNVEGAQPVQVGKGEWMLHKVEPAAPPVDAPVVTPKAPIAPETAPVVESAQPVLDPAAPASPAAAAAVIEQPKPSTSKEIWQQTLDEYAGAKPTEPAQPAGAMIKQYSPEYEKALGEYGRKSSAHFLAVEEAAKNQKPVPPSVLEQYKDSGFYSRQALERVNQPAAIAPRPAAEAAAHSLRGLAPEAARTVHSIDLTQVQPGQKIEGLGKFVGVDDEGLPIMSRSGGAKRPGESGVAYSPETLGTLLKQSGDVLTPEDLPMLQQIMQDIAEGKATQFVGRSKVGRSADMSASADFAGPQTLGNDRVMSVYFKPASKKVPAQVVADVIDSNGMPAKRIIREAGDPEVGFIRQGAGDLREQHFPTSLDPTKRALASDAVIQKAGIVRQKAMGTKHENNPIVQRMDESLKANDVAGLEKAIRDFDRLPPELQKQLGVESGCVK